MTSTINTAIDHMRSTIKEAQGYPLGHQVSIVGRFLWHMLQMILAMEAGMMAYHYLLRPILAPTGYTALTQAYPLFGYWMMEVSMVLGMLALMCYHRSTWRYSLEMTLAMLAPVSVLTVLVLWSLIPIHILYGIGDPMMFLGMAVYMIYRPHDHAHSALEHSGHQHSRSFENETSKHTVQEPGKVHNQNQKSHPCRKGQQVGRW